MKSKCLLAMTLLLVTTAPLFSQATTSGGVIGMVTDSSGAVVPGVTVELSGPAMQGTRTDVADARGQYRFLHVPPGENYRLTATLSGFAPVTKTINRVYLGQDATIDVSMRAAVAEAITVTAEAPLVDVTRTTIGVNITSSQFATLPAARSFQQLTTLAPGVTLEMSEHDSRQLANSPNVGASSAPENNYIIDGLSTTDTRFGTSGTNLAMNFVEEVQVMTGGYSAEYGRSTGGVFNVITKSGGNDFSGDVFGYYKSKSWSKEAPRSAGSGSTLLADLGTTKDFGVDVGGPIMRDRLWFFGAFDPTRSNVDVGGIRDDATGKINNTPTSYTERTTFYAGKMTWGITPNHNVVVSAFGDPTHREGWLESSFFQSLDAAGRVADVGSKNIAGRYTGVLSQAWLIEGLLGRFTATHNRHALTEIGRTVPRQTDLFGGLVYGGAPAVFADKESRNAYALKLTNSFGAHDLRYGVDVEKNKYDEKVHGFNYVGFFATVPLKEGGREKRWVMSQREYTVDAVGNTDNNAAFLQDQWKLLPNLHLNLGVRYEEQRLSSNAGALVAGNAEEMSHPRHVDAIKLGNNWAPRLGIVWDPLNNGRSKIYGYFGRFFEAVPLDINIRALNGEAYPIRWFYAPMGVNETNFYNPKGDPLSLYNYTLYRESLLTQADVATPVAADLKAQYQDEYIVGGEYQFGSAWSTGIRFVDRELKRVIEDFGTFLNPDDPTELTGYAIGNPGEGAFGKPYYRPKRYSHAAELTLQRARVDNWQLYASYVYAAARGNYEGLYMSGFDQLDPNITALYDIPSFMPNAYGKLRADKPYQFKVAAAWSFPFGVTLSENLLYSAGIPISVLGPEIVNGYGDGVINLLPRGSGGRTPNYWNLDLHADYKFPIMGGGRRGLSAIVDLFNATNNHQVLEVNQSYVSQGMPGIELWEADANLDAFGNPKYNPSLPPNPYYKTPTLWQYPRTVQVGLKFTY